MQQIRENLDITSGQEVRTKMTTEGLYNPKDEHDACGVGLIASIDGKSRR